MLAFPREVVPMPLLSELPRRGARALLSPVIGQIVRTLVADAAGSEAGLDEDALASTAQAMRGRIAIMPRFLGLPMAGATVFFDVSGVITGGRPFRMQSAEQRARQVRLWRAAPVSFCQDFLEFYGKMATFVYFSELHPEQEH
jgi:hypothetical protein